MLTPPPLGEADGNMDDPVALVVVKLAGLVLVTVAETVAATRWISSSDQHIELKSGSDDFGVDDVFTTDLAWTCFEVIVTSGVRTGSVEETVLWPDLLLLFPAAAAKTSAMLLLKVKGIALESTASG